MGFNDANYRMDRELLMLEKLKQGVSATLDNELENP